MQLNNRQKKILLVLLEKTDRITGKELANFLNVSLRTVQTEIHDINNFLPRTISSSNRGYKLIDKDKLAGNINLSLNEISSEQKMLQEKIFFAEAALDIDELADQFYLSTSLLNKYLNNIKHDFKKYNLKLNRKKNKLSISGSEYDKRLFIRNIIVSELVNENKSWEMTSLKISASDYTHVKSIVLTTIEEFNYYIDKPYLTNLVINVLITLYRDRQAHFIEKIKYNVFKESIEFQIAQRICGRLTDHWPIIIPKNDIEYIALSISGQIEPKQSLDSMTNNYQISKTIKSIIKEVFNYYLLTLDYDDILPHFITHIRSLLKRAKSKQFITNTSIINSVKETSPFTYDVAIHLTKLLEDKFLVKIPPTEIDLLSIYIGYVIEQTSQKDDRIKVGICCPDYRHISKILSKQLKESFASKIQIVFVDKRVPTQHEINQVELIISTIKFNSMGKPFVLISPFFSENEKLKIEKKIILVKQMKDEIAQKNSLATYFNKRLFFKNKNLTSKRDVIYFLGKAIVEEGIVQENFIQSVYQRETISSTCFFNLFAVPHAIELNAKKTQIAVLLEENGIEWDKGHKINCVFMIAVSHSDRKEFMKLYNSFIQVLCNPKSIQKIILSESFEQFIANFLR